MADLRHVLKAKFEPPCRYNNFGNILMSIQVHGFRCHTDTVIDIASPITAFCGLNGTGKSTLLQLAAAAYKQSAATERRFYIKDFIVAGMLDPTPFTDDATVTYGLWQENRTIKKIAVDRIKSESRWRGYKRQPHRTVYFAGMGLYLPRIEVRDFVVRNATKLTLLQSELLPERSKQWACKILGCHYDQMNTNTVSHAARSSNVVTVQRSGKIYSEANMGCGEGRIQHIIRELETLPEKSLILLEEPETSLHPSAQHEFGKYLIDVSATKHHQIIITTHSEYLLKALPSESRIYLDRTLGNIRTFNGITTSQAVSLMTGGHDKALHILVEDDVAKAILTEIIRKADANFLKTIQIHEAGDTKTINSVVKALKDTGLPVAAVRDADKEGSAKDNIFKLPGTLPPEKEVFNATVVKEALAVKYGVDFNAFLALNQGTDHHDWFTILSQQIAIDSAALIQQAAEVYVTGLSANDTDTLTKLLKESITT